MHDATLAEAQWPLHGRVSGIGELQVLGGQVAAVWRKFRAPKHSKRRILVRPVSAYAPPAVGLSTRAHPCGQVLSAPLPAGLCTWTLLVSRKAPSCLHQPSFWKEMASFQGVSTFWGRCRGRDSSFWPSSSCRTRHGTANSRLAADSAVSLKQPLAARFFLREGDGGSTTI